MTLPSPLHALPKTGEVHVWTIPLDRSRVAELQDCLSAEEKTRAERLRVTEIRERFIVCRASVRQILGDYAGLSANEVPLDTTATGKPIWTTGNDPSLSFSIAHCGDLALLAVSSGVAVGIDLELVDNRLRPHALAAQMLSAREMAIFARLESDQQAAAILRAWTRKEAFLKAVGCGLGRPAAEVEVTFLDDEPPRVLATGELNEHPQDWALASWQLAVGGFAAVAARQEQSPLLIHHLFATSVQGASIVVRPAFACEA